MKDFGVADRELFEVSDAKTDKEAVSP